MTVHDNDPIRSFRWPLTGALAAFLAAAAVGAVSAQDAEKTTVLQPATQEASCWGAPSGTANSGRPTDGYVLGPGDLLRITLYQRPELSGEFRIREDGHISLPFLGLVDVKGLDLISTQEVIAKNFEAKAGIPISVSLEVVERRPFYVMGLVNNQGAHPYARGLTVLRAIAMSGGLFRPGLSMGPTIDITREAARLGQADSELKRNLARRARLLAERDGKEKLEAPQELVDLATPDVVQELMTAERRLMHQRVAAFESEVKGRAASVKLAKEVISSLEEQHKAMVQQVELARKEQAISEDLLKKGLSRRGDLLTMQRVMANLEATERELVARIARAKFDLVTAQLAENLLDVNRSVQLEQELGAVEGQIAANELSIRYSKRIIQTLTSIPVNRNSIETTMKYEIIRNDGDAQKIIEVTEMSPVCPDDVLRVMPAPED